MASWAREAVAQVARTADVDVVRRVVVSTRKGREEVEVLRGSFHGVVTLLSLQRCPPLINKLVRVGSGRGWRRARVVGDHVPTFEQLLIGLLTSSSTSGRGGGGR